MKQDTCRKFTVSKDTIAFEDFTEFSERYFKLFTFKFSSFSEAKTWKQKLKIVLSDVFFWFSALNVCAFVALGVAAALKKSSGIVALTFSMPLIASISLVVVKCLTVYCNKSRISEVLSMLEMVLPRDKFMQKKYNIRSYHKSYKLFARIYAALFMLPCVSVMVIQLIKLASSGDRTFPLNMWFPLESERSEIYAIVFIWSVWACANSVLILIAVDSLMFVIITLVSMGFDMLYIDFKDLANIEPSSFEQRTEELIQRHNDLIDCSKKIENIFSPSFLFNFVQSSFVICLTAFQYSTSTEATQFFFSGTYCAAILNQVWLLCYFGQKVIDSSDFIANGAYISGWEKIEKIEVKKAIMLAIQRSQNPTKLTAMNFADVSLKSFTSVEPIKTLIIYCLLQSNNFL